MLIRPFTYQVSATKEYKFSGYADYSVKLRKIWKLEEPVKANDKGNGYMNELIPEIGQKIC